MNRFLKLIVSILISLPLCSCAGGSRGTGGVEIDGKLLDSSKQPLIGVQVTLLDNGTQTITDANGNFVLASTTTGEPLLKFDSAELSTQVSIKGIPSDAEVVQVTIEIDTTDDSAAVTEVKVRSRRSDDSDDREDRDEGDDSDNSGSGSSNSGSNDDRDERDNSGSGSDDRDDDSKGSGGGISGSNPGNSGRDDNDRDSRDDDSGSGSGSDDRDDAPDNSDGRDDDSKNNDDSDDDDDDNNSGRRSGEPEER